MLSHSTRCVFSFSSKALDLESVTAILRKYFFLAKAVENKVKLENGQVLMWSLDFREEGARATVELCEKGTVPDASCATGSSSGSILTKLSDSGLGIYVCCFRLDMIGEKPWNFVVRRIVHDLKERPYKR